MTSVPEIYTIGVYGLTADEFFNKLLENHIDTFIDIRRRRAVRGSKFSFVNSNRLQNKLKEIGIKYLHVLDLAPTNEIRNLQKEADKKGGILKKERKELGEVFKSEYEHQILDKYNLHELISALKTLETRRAVLFCVEKEPKACHRSLVADKLEKEFSLKPKHI